MPATIFITTPNGQHHCAGEYKQLAGEKANGRPVWKQRAGSCWLYSGTNGMWIVGGSDARDKNFDCSHGVLFCRTLHGGIMPDQVSGFWERLAGERFIEDSAIKVSTTYYKPFALRVVSPNGQQRCTGEYILMSEAMANGLPLWKHKSGRSFLYCGTNGSWVVGGADARSKKFKCARGVVFSKRKSGGLMPDKTEGVWLRLSGKEFNEDAAISVSVMPSPLYVQSPNWQQGCAGEFVPVADKLANGYPLWQHVGGKCWLFSGSNGMWIIGGKDAQAKNFNCTRGVIYCKTVHTGEMPDKMVGPWLRLKDDSFREDADISVSSKPAVLHIVSPNGQQKCAGEYLLVANERFRGQPVWKQRRGHFRICSSKDGTWMVVTGTPKEGNVEQAKLAALRCQQPHFGLMPHKVRGIWSRFANEKPEKDDTIKVTCTVAKPAKLHVTTPSGQQKCGGEYALVAGESANNHPLWKQMGGKYWLYSGTNGLWIIGSSSAQKKNFECSRGVIYSAVPHGGQWPNQVSGAWLRLEGEQFVEDNSISVNL